MLERMAPSSLSCQVPIRLLILCPNGMDSFDEGKVDTFECGRKSVVQREKRKKIH